MDTRTYKDGYCDAFKILRDALKRGLEEMEALNDEILKAPTDENDK